MMTSDHENSSNETELFFFYFHSFFECSKCYFSQFFPSASLHPINSSFISIKAQWALPHPHRNLRLWGNNFFELCIEKRLDELKRFSSFDNNNRRVCFFSVVSILSIFASLLVSVSNELTSKKITQFLFY